MGILCDKKHKSIRYPTTNTHIVQFQISLYLRLPLGAVGGLVERQQHRLAAAGQHHAVEAAVHRAHLRGHELSNLVEALLG